MAKDKKGEFGKRKQLLANYAKAISHPARISILRILAREDTCSCQQIVDELPLSQSTVSQHLKELKLSGLIESSIEGPKSNYKLIKSAIHEFEHEMDRLIHIISSKKK